MDGTRAQAILNNFSGKGIAVLGDLMVDRYIWGKAKRISQEAPVPVVVVQKTSLQPGGAGNVLRNITALGAKAYALGIVGDDENGRALRDLLKELNVRDAGIVTDSKRSTTEKRRIIANNQQLLRVDSEEIHSLEKDLSDELLEKLRQTLREGAVDGIILEDYGKGVLSRHMVKEVVAIAREYGLPVALDPHPSNTFDVEGITLLTPNRSEAFALARHYHTDPIEPVEKDEALIKVLKELKRLWNPETLLVTLGRGGMALSERDGTFHHVPTRAREVFDVSGAGDTVIAAFVLALLGGGSTREAAYFANHAAGVVVGKLGTASVSPDELMTSFRTDGPE